MTSPRKYIFFDLDECLLHTTFCGEKPLDYRDELYGSGKPGSIVFNLTSGVTPGMKEIYRASLRGGVLGLLAAARELYPEDGAIRILTTSSQDYSGRLNELFRLGFQPDHIHHRNDISGLAILDRITDGRRPTYLIDNLFIQDNHTKVSYLRPIVDGVLNYHRVREYWRSPDDDFTEHEIRRILNFISDKEDETDFYSGKI